MRVRRSEILEELRSVVSGKTADALLPPLVYALLNNSIGLEAAALSALSLSAVLGLWRLARKQQWHYAFGGFAAVAIAAGLAYFTQNAANYFLSAVVTSAVLLAATLLSILAGKPVAAWASHLTRGWPIAWFWRHDVKPAYREVSVVWAIFLTVRLAVQVYLLSAGDALRLGLANILLGWPVTLPVLVMSYIYGVWRLRRLGGPGVEEFLAGKAPPWQGQVRGF